MTTWTVNTETLLFENLTFEDALVLEDLSYQGQINGEMFMDHPATEAWFRVASSGESARYLFLMYSVVFLPRAALSASMFFKSLLGVVK